MGQQLFQHVGGLQLQCTGADARVAGEKGRVIDLAVDEQPDTVLRIVGQAQNGGGARVAAQQLPQALLRGEAQAGGADLRAEVLSVEGLVRRHAQQIERGFLPVSQKQVLAYGHVQYAADLGAQLHVEGGVMADAVVFDAQLVQQVEGCGLLWQQLALRTGVMGYGGDGHCASPRFSSISPAR